MICFGILTVPKKKVSLVQKLKSPVVLEETFSTQAQIQVASFTWTEEELLRLPHWIRMRILQRGMKRLNKCGCAKTGLDMRYRHIFGLTNPEERFISHITPAMMPKAANFCIEQYATMPFSVILQANPLSLIQNELLLFLCPNASNLIILTEDTEQAELLGEDICNEYGFYPQILTNLPCLPADHLLIDIEHGLLCFNENLMDGIECKMDVHQYQVCQAYFLNESSIPPENLEFVSWTKGKKRLTSR